MNKLNKKGFTLIEMLVVIAIIAILVAIMIPIVTGATTKARAATDAANLRTAKASLSIAYLDGAIKIGGTGNNMPTGYGETPECKTDSSWTFYWKLDESSDEVIVQFGSLTIDDFANTAETGTALSSSGTGGAGGGSETQKCTCTVGDTAGCCDNPKKSDWGSNCRSCYSTYKAAATCACGHSHKAGEVCGK